MDMQPVAYKDYPTVQLPPFIGSKIVNQLPQNAVQSEFGIPVIKVKIGSAVSAIQVYSTLPAPVQNINNYALVNIGASNEEKYLNKAELAKTLLVDGKLLEESCYGNLNLLFTAAKDIPLSDHRQKDIETRYRMSILRMIKEKYDVPFDKLKKIYDWCEENAELLEKTFQESKEENPGIKYEVFIDPSDDFKIEYRGPRNVRLRVIKNELEGSSIKLSGHVDIYRGDRFYKGKYWLSGAANKEVYSNAPARILNLKSFIRHAAIITAIRDTEGVVTFVRPPEIQSKEKKSGVLCKAYVYLEVIEGENLKEILEPKHPLYDDVKAKCRIIEDVARALERIHKKGIVHRDIKPDNVMLLAGNRIKIIDFDIANFVTRPQSTASGSKPYIDPYLKYLYMTGVHHSLVNPSADLHNLAVMAYFLFFKSYPQLSLQFREKEYNVMQKADRSYNVEGINDFYSKDLKAFSEQFPAIVEVLCLMFNAEGNKRLSLSKVAENFQRLGLN